MLRDTARVYGCGGHTSVLVYPTARQVSAHRRKLDCTSSGSMFIMQTVETSFQSNVRVAIEMTDGRSETASREPIDLEALVGAEWAEWYRMTPAERWVETEKLWRVYLEMGGSLDPEPDPQSPFFDAD